MGRLSYLTVGTWYRIGTLTRILFRKGRNGCEVIIEAVVSTLDESGRVNLAPMGVVWGEERLVIRPYKATTTYRNLTATGQAVVNLTDNVGVFAHTAVEDAEYACLPAAVVSGFVLADACAYREVVVETIDDRAERASITCRVVYAERLRDFLGFNRGKNAVLEAAILATRLRWLGREAVLAEFKRLAEIVEKTGGEQEKAALTFLDEYVGRWGNDGKS